MGTGDSALIDELYRIDGKAEIVDGAIVRMSPAGVDHGYAATAIGATLFAHGRRTRSGHGLADNVGFIVDLPNRRSFSPDAAFWTHPATSEFGDGAPVFAVEIRSPEDYLPAAEQRLAQKRTDYFAAGTHVVWDVALQPAPQVRCYRADAPAAPRVFNAGEIADAEPAVPGWAMPVIDLVPPA
jgi:Uma2 family endonuclease